MALGWRRDVHDVRPGLGQHRVEVAVPALDAEPTRELLELAVLQRLPYAEVGDILQIPVGTVKSRVFYALRRMRDRVAGFDPPADGDSE